MTRAFNSRAALLFALHQPTVEFASSANSAASGSSPRVLTKPTGLVLGDLVVVHVEDTETAVTLSTSGGGAWNKSFVAASGLNSDGDALFWKFLESADLSGDWTVSYGGQGSLAARYRSEGATAAAVKSTATALGSPLSLAGFTKAARHWGVITAVAAGSGATAFTPPTHFDERYDAAPVSSRIGLADRRSGYVDGAAVAWTGFTSSTARGFLLEVTG